MALAAYKMEKMKQLHSVGAKDTLTSFAPSSLPTGTIASSMLHKRDMRTPQLAIRKLQETYNKLAEMQEL